MQIHPSNTASPAGPGLYLRAAAMLAAACATHAFAALDEIVVMAQKREESIQDVPIAITAFTADALRIRQIAGFADLRFVSPSTSYGKGNFTGNNFKIRGIGTDLTSPSSDDGVGMHINEVPLHTPRLFETEFFDTEQLLILRGPQGTLYGRNSTGGAVNLVTRTARTGAREADIELQLGSYRHRMANGAINLPVGDTVALRLAGIVLKRDGYTENTYTGNDIDGRDQYSLRGSLRWTPMDSTTIDLMLSWFEEDSTRTRSQKAMCHQDPGGIYGCLPDRLGFEQPHPASLFQNTLASTAVLQGLGIYPFLSNPPQLTPRDVRRIHADRDPVYETDETLATLHLEHEFESYTLDMILGYQDTSLLSQTDYLGDVGQAIAIPAALRMLGPLTARQFGDGRIPLSAPSANATGSVGGHVDSRIDRLENYDQSDSVAEQFSIEARIASRYDGRLNFLAGAFYMDVDTRNDYWLFSSALDYFALVRPLTIGVPGSLDGLGLVAPNFDANTESYGIESRALFGELYLEPSSTLKLTLGARYTMDRKSIHDAQMLFANGGTALQPIGADQPIPASFRRSRGEWNEWTGRAVIDWTPADAVLLYASYSRGYKGGGFNPPFDPVVFPGENEEFDPEFIDAFEIGIKSDLLDKRLMANATAYLYDYQGLQLSQIVNRTVFNRNADARLHGVELELLFAPDDRWQLNANISWERSRIRNFSSIDPRDPTAGRSDVTLLRDITNGTLCVAQVPAATYAALAGASRFTDCAALANHAVLGPLLGITGGIPVGLGGNELPLTPEWKIGLGAQYRVVLPRDYSLLLRVDYYWQGDSWGRVFNREPIDRIEDWDIWNAQATLERPGSRWYARAWVRNIADEDSLTNMYLSDAATGLFTNVFTTEPRTVGVALGYRF